MLMRLRHPFDVRYGARQHVFQIVFNCCSIVFAVVSQPGACVFWNCQVVWCQDAMRMLGAAEKLREHKTRRLTAVMESSAMLVRGALFPLAPISCALCTCHMQ